MPDPVQRPHVPCGQRHFNGQSTSKLHKSSLGYRSHIAIALVGLATLTWRQLQLPDLFVGTLQRVSSSVWTSSGLWGSGVESDRDK